MEGFKGHTKNNKRTDMGVFPREQHQGLIRGNSPPFKYLQMCARLKCFPSFHFLNESHCSFPASLSAIVNWVRAEK